MLDLLVVPVTILYLLIVGALFIYGLNFFYLSLRALRDREPSAPPPPPAEWPQVTVQLPIFNELYVAERLVDAVARLDYPAGKLEIQVLDDSTDETSEIVRRTVQRLKQVGVLVEQLQRPSRVGFKAGALAHGLERAHGEFVAIFDADFIPGSDFLRRTIPYFQDPTIAFIQTRWAHVNRDYTLFTYLQSLAIDAHFMIEQFARSREHFWFNFNGTAGVWRRVAMEDAGGWESDTLTEDLDLSYRAFLKGWNAVYLRDVEVPAELPVSFSAYRRQQGRWARGSFECALKLLPRVWQSSAPWSSKVQATLHLTGYGIHFLLFALMILYPLVLLLSISFPMLFSIFGLTLGLNVTTFAPTLLFALGQQQLKRNWIRQMPGVLLISVLGAGMMVNTARAGWQAISHGAAVFERTPKFGISARGQSWQARRYQLRVDPIVWIEMSLAFVNAWTTWNAVRVGNFAIALYSSLFCMGMLFASGLTLLQGIEVHRNRGRSQHTIPPA